MPPFLHPEVAIHQPRPWWRLGLGLAALGTGFVSGGTAGMMVDSTPVVIGPHEAEASLTFNRTATFDAGPLDEGFLPLDWPLPLGVKLEIKGGLPGDAPAAQAGPSGVGLEQYIKLFGNAEHDIDRAWKEVLKTGMKYGLLADLGLVALAGVYLSYGKRRRHEIKEEAWDALDTLRHSRLLQLAAAVNVLGQLVVGGNAVSAATQSPIPAEAEPAAVLDGTPLEGLQATGYLSFLLNDAAPPIIDAYRTNERFYNKATDNLKAEMAKGRLLKPSRDSVLALFYSDFHCNLGMARVIGALDNESGANLVMDGGDTTASGASWQDVCIRAVADAIGNVDDRAVVSPGNHESPTSEKQYRRAGFTVTNGETIDLAGINILGDDDPMRSSLGIDAEQEGDESFEDISRRLASQACAEQSEVLLVHTPEIAAEAIRRGCADVVLSGHKHEQQIIRTQSGAGKPGIMIVGDNASGARGSNLSIGPLQRATHLYLLSFSKETGDLDAYQIVTINTDASVKLGSIVKLVTGE